MKRATSPRLRAFTLIELLVVILIIGILAALLFPVFGLIREKGRRVKCLSNLHHLNLAWNSYLTDNKGGLPSPVPSNNVGWIGSDVPSNIENGVLYPYVNDTNVFRCPSQPLSSYRVSYSMNTNATGNFIAILNPPKLLLLIEDLDANSSYGPGDAFNVGNTSTTLIDSPAVWHQNGSCLSFADGHVEYWVWQDANSLKTIMGQHSKSISSVNDWTRLNNAWNGN